MIEALARNVGNLRTGTLLEMPIGCRNCHKSRYLSCIMHNPMLMPSSSPGQLRRPKPHRSGAQEGQMNITNGCSIPTIHLMRPRRTPPHTIRRTRINIPLTLHLLRNIPRTLHFMRRRISRQLRMTVRAILPCPERHDLRLLAFLELLAVGTSVEF